MEAAQNMRRVCLRDKHKECQVFCLYWVDNTYPFFCTRFLLITLKIENVKS